MKTCKGCSIEQSLDAFRKWKGSKDGYHPRCKECDKKYRESMKDHIAEKNRIHYQNNKENRDAQAKLYREANKEQIYEQKKKYREKNKAHIQEMQKKYLPTRKKQIKERRKNDVNFQLTEILRSKIHKQIRGETTSYQEWIGLSPDIFRRWLEFQFTPEMTWDNLGSYWHIDHIIPVSIFDFSLQQDKYVGFGWTNLQPLERRENQSKSAKIQLHYYFNSIITIHRFIQNEQLDISEYQRIDESRSWIRNNLMYGNKLVDRKVVHTTTLKIDNQQPSL